MVQRNDEKIMWESGWRQGLNIDSIEGVEK